jgi:hypothetical protein
MTVAEGKIIVQRFDTLFKLSKRGSRDDPK